MKLKNLLCLVLVYVLCSSCAFATKLPDPLIEYIRNDIPKAAIRFDGLIRLPDGTIYLPVLPSQPNKEGKWTVVKTYPAKKKLSQNPDVILFDTNFALLKVLKNKQGNPTFTNSDNIPLVVKTGILPQDLLVPPGMIIADDLKILMGDLAIPTISSPVNNFFAQEPRVAPVKPAVLTTKVPQLNNKTLLMTSLESTSVTVMPANSATPSFTLRLESLPRFIQPVDNDKYLLVATAGKTYIDVADLNLEVLAKKIDLSFQPSEAVVSNGKAYIAVSDDESIFVIDLKSMAVLEKIKIKGYPKHIALSEDGSYLAYVDKMTNDIYTLDVSNKAYENKFIVNCANVSKLYAKSNLIYALSRTKNKLEVIDTDISDFIYAENVGEKPIDMLDYKGHLYVLCANNEIHIFNLDDYQIVDVKKLDTKGFSKQITRVSNTNLAIITNAVDKKYFVYDLDKNTVIQTVPTTVTVNKLNLINKTAK